MIGSLGASGSGTAACGGAPAAGMPQDAPPHGPFVGGSVRMAHVEPQGMPAPSAAAAVAATGHAFRPSRHGRPPSRWALAALLACGARLATAASITYPGPAAATQLSVAQAAASIAAGPLGSRPLKAGLINVLPPDAPNQLGVDGFSRLAAVDSAAAAAVLAAPVDTLVAVNASDVTGALPWLLNWVAAQGNFSVSYNVVRLSDAVEATPDATARALYAMQTHGLDVVLVQMTLDPGRLLYFRMMPVQSFGYQIVTTRPTLVQVPFAERAFVWARPFTPSLWLLYTGAVVFTSMMMLVFERNRNEEQFGDHIIGSEVEAVGQSVYLAAMGAVLKEMYSPSTAAGRVYTGTKSFCIFLLISMYIANLAAVFTTGDSIDQPVSGLSDFAPNAVPLCTLDDDSTLSWLQLNAPVLFSRGLVVTPSTDLASSLSGVLAGTCAGAMGTSADVAFALGSEGDPNGNFCDLVPVGQVMGNSFISVPFTSDTTLLPSATYDAITSLTAMAISSGNYSSIALEQFMPPDASRSHCVAEAQASAAQVAFADSGALDIQDLSGVFIVQASGLALSLIVYFTKRQRQWLYLKIDTFFRCTGQSPRIPLPGMLDANSIEEVANDEAAIELAAVSAAMAELTTRLATIHQTAGARRRALIMQARKTKADALRDP